MEKMTIFNANDVLNIIQTPTGRAGVWFLNWKISAKPMSQRHDSISTQFAGAGLYGLCFDGRLIYIGSYLGEGNVTGVNFTGDVVSSRWSTHIGAITARGSRLHIAPRSLIDLSLLLDEEHVLVDGFLGSQRQILHTDDGNLSPLRRLVFAAGLSQEFLAPDVIPEQVLSRFTFVYVRYDTLPEGTDRIGLKVHIEAAEKSLIRQLAPVCNSTHVPRGAESINVSCVDVKVLLQQALGQIVLPNEVLPQVDDEEVLLHQILGQIELSNDALPQGDALPQCANVLPHDERHLPTDKDGNVEVLAADWDRIFWTRLPPDPHPSRAIVDSLCGLAIRSCVQTYYTGTNGADLRFKAPTQSGRLRVFMTITWRNRNQIIIVRSLCPTIEAQSYLVQLAEQESIVNTVPPEPLLSELKLTADIGRLIGLRQVFLHALKEAYQLP
jgi:hypothetical protein